MSHPVCVPTTSPGDIRDQILSTRAEVIDGVIFLRFDPGYYRAKYYAVFINGVYTGQNVYAPMLGVVEAAYPIGPGTTVGSIYIEDAGDWSAFDGFVPTPFVEEMEADSARRLRMSWSATYSASTVRGDSQLSSITITGAKRGVNVEANPLRKTRGTLTYAIEAVGAARIVRWYAGTKMVAEGSRSGNGAVTCSEVNGSGLSVACTLTYSADLAPGTAEIELRWPKEYQIHYSTSSLSYPRTPEDTVTDNGGSAFFYQTAVLAAGSYNYNVVPVDDEGDEQASPSAPSDSPKTIYGPPAAPTITGVTINGGTPTIESSSDTQAAGAFTLSIGVTPAGSSRLLVVITAHDQGSSGNKVTDIDFGGVALTKFSEDIADSDNACSIWYLSNPAAGLDTVTANLSATRNVYMAVIAFSSANGIANAFATSTASASSISSSTPSAPSNGLRLFVAGGTSDGGTVSVNQGGTQILDEVRGGDAERLAVGYDSSGAYGAAADTTAASMFLYGVQVAGTGPYTLTPTWTAGETGCTYTLYYSYPGEPVNLGTKATPAPVTTALNATSATTAAITGYAPSSLVSARTTLASDLATAVSTANASYTQAAFPAAFATLLTDCVDAIETYCTALGIRPVAWTSQLAERHALILAYINDLPTLSADRWKDQTAPAYTGWLALLGTMLDRKPDYFLAPNGGVPGGTTGSTTTGTGTNIFGYVSYDQGPVAVSLYEMSKPPILYKPIRLIVRATKGGLEETRDEETVVEIFANGLGVGTRPNMAYVSELTFSNSLTLTAVAYVESANAFVDATHLDLFVKAYASGEIDPTTDVRVYTAEVVTAPDGEPYASLSYTVPSSGHYRVAVLARANDALSSTWTERVVYLSNDTPSAVSGLTASVIRGTGIVLP